MINLYKFYKRNIIKNKFLYVLSVDVKKGEVPQYVEIICKKRKNFMKFMKKNNIQCREFYPSVSFSQFVNKSKNKKSNDNIYSKHGVFLPSGPHQKIKDIKKVIKYINIFIKKNYLN